VDEGIVEGGKDSGNAKDKLALIVWSMLFRAGVRGQLASRTWGPSCGKVSIHYHRVLLMVATWMFSCAPRSTFFLGGMLAVGCC
jgi:hypothetical protein